MVSLLCPRWYPFNNLDVKIFVSFLLKLQLLFSQWFNEWINRWSFLVGCPKSRRLSGVDFQGGFNLENGDVNNFL
jgi:hypothetical protein